MIFNRIFSFLILIFFSVSSFSIEELPVKFFASLPDVHRVKLAPSGNKLAMMKRIERKGTIATVIEVTDLNSGKKSYPVIDETDDYDILWFRWANDNKILISATFYEQRNMQATGFSARTTERRLLILDLEKSLLQNILTKPMVKRYTQNEWQPTRQDYVVDMLPDDENHILHAIDWNAYRAPQVFKVNLDTRRRKMVQIQQKDWTTWVSDLDGDVRAGVFSKAMTGSFEDDRQEYRVNIKVKGSKKWKELWRFEALSEESVWPLGFGVEPNELYVRAYHDDRKAIFKVDLNTPDKKELIYFDKKYDVTGGLVRSNKTGEFVGVFVKEGIHYWDAEYKAFAAGIDKALPNTNNLVLELSKDERKYIVLSVSDVDAGTYYLGDRDKKSLDPIAFKYNNLDPAQMSATEQLTYKTRDGVEIEAYLTMPKGNTNKNLPAIIFPHGGPITFDNGRFDYWTQFFASRGYAVLQVNFRGSYGYGYDFMKAGIQSWGKEMQDDVEDGARWLINQGAVNPDKMCIVGASYGGYAALMGVAKTPDLYKCAISFAGISDVYGLVRAHKNWTSYQGVKDQVGDNAGKLKSISPYKYAKDIKAPVLLIHGDEDRTVRIEQSKKMLGALKSEKKSVAYIELEGGDHYLSINKNRIQAFTEMDRFLKKHLQ